MFVATIVVLLSLFVISPVVSLKFQSFHVKSSNSFRTNQNNMINLNGPLTLKKDHIKLYNSNRSVQPSNNNSNKPSSSGLEPKYVVALVVFLLACVYDKIVMHGGF